MTDDYTPNTLGKYRLIGELGHGGMARVYLALATGPAGFNKLVVIKQILSHHADDPEFVAMFLDEARLAARLNHPNVVQTNEVDQDGQRYFMAMEHLEGQSFHTVVKRLARGKHKRLTVEMQLRVLIEALAGLHYAHELTDYDGTPLSVVHRDMSPHNLFITYSGQVKVMDFGIAKALSSTTETRSGMLKGKAAYMAPEQALGERVDRRADLFAVGIMLWESVAGERMFKRGTPDIAMVQKLISGNIPKPSEVAPDTPAALEAIVLKALSTDREARYATALELQADLEAYLKSIGDETTCRDIGALMAEGFAEERERIRTLVEAQIREAEAHTLREVPLLDTGSASITGSVDGPHTHTPTAETSVPRAVRHETSSPGVTKSTVVLSGQSSSPRRSFKPAALLAVAAVLLGAGGAVLFWSQRDDAPPAPAEPPGEPAKELSLRISSKPPGAAVRCEQKFLGNTPLEVAVKAGEPHCRFILSQEGYEPYPLEPAALDSNLTVLAQLVPLTKPAASVTAPGSASAGATAEAKVRPVARVQPQAPAVTQPPPPPPPPTKPALEIRTNR